MFPYWEQDYAKCTLTRNLIVTESYQGSRPRDLNRTWLPSLQNPLRQVSVTKFRFFHYFYGANIGVISLNGSGKSSLLRILAGVDKEFNGEAVLSPGYTVGFWSRNRLSTVRPSRGRMVPKFRRKRDTKR